MYNCAFVNNNICKSVGVISQDGWVLSKSLPNFPSNQRETILQKKQGTQTQKKRTRVRKIY